MQERQDGIATLLTAQQVQTMLHVDRSTVYRMADDGRLPAIKVGKQWRFPARSVAALLDVTHQPDSRVPPASPPASPPPAAAPVPGELPPATAAAVVDVAADLLGVMMVVTDMQGRPVTGVANPCPWFAQHADDPTAIAACVEEWRALAEELDFEPRLRTGALGFECARAFVRCGTSLVGMVLAGGIAPAGHDDPDLYVLDERQRDAVVAALPRVAAALSRAVSDVSGRSWS